MRKSDVPEVGFSENNQSVLRTMRKYGIILADIGNILYSVGLPAAQCLRRNACGAMPTDLPSELSACGPV